jgi:23S rRNA (adenine2030-N6)-methyltransferase
VNYRHAFHAGNFADVHKHVVLLALLEHLHKKPKPFFFLDTHAGRGLYDLQSDDALRGGEWQQGIGRIRKTDPPLAGIEHYLAIVGSTGQTYPGSPLIAAEMLRENDRAVFVEKHPTEATALKEILGRRKHVSVLMEDGYVALKAHLPPKENRGLVLIDPPYENDSEFADIARALQGALARWPNGTYCVWYPIKPSNSEQRLHRTLVDASIKKILVLELNIRPSDSPLGLNGSGLLIVNPPYQLDEQMRVLLPQLHRALVPEQTGGVRIEWLAGE